ncbi:alpha-glucuronidase [Aureococcus anophagefferens]|nr:alpha-glucuronidase [Aureococcus anophagefferens]
MAIRLAVAALLVHGVTADGGVRRDVPGDGADAAPAAGARERVVARSRELGAEGYRLRGATIEAATASGAFYGAFALLGLIQRREPLPAVRTSVPRTRLRHWDLWDELDGSVTRYAGRSLFWPMALFEDAAPPPMDQVYLAPCDASDPRQRWSGATLEAGASGPSAIANEATGGCLTTASQLPRHQRRVGPDLDMYRCHSTDEGDYTHQRFVVDGATIRSARDRTACLGVSRPNPPWEGAADPWVPAGAWKARVSDALRALKSAGLNGVVLLDVNACGPTQTHALRTGPMHQIAENLRPLFERYAMAPLLSACFAAPTELDGADGANMMADALRASSNSSWLLWRAFVYGTDDAVGQEDLARQAYDTFEPLDGRKMRSAYSVTDVSSVRHHDTRLIVHPLYPQGAAHWLHPCEHLRAFSDVRVPGLPFALQVPQRQGVGGDDTGCAVWRGATVLARRLLTTACEGRAGNGRRPVAVELGCGAGAIAAAVASYLGCDAWGTDMPDIAKDAAGACRDHAATAAAGRRSGALRGAARVVYALTKTRVAEAIAVFEKLAATIAALLNDGGVCLIAYCPRSDVEAYFFDMLPKHGLGPNAPSAVASGYDGKGNGVPRGDITKTLEAAKASVAGVTDKIGASAFTASRSAVEASRKIDDEGTPLRAGIGFLRESLSGFLAKGHGAATSASAEVDGMVSVVRARVAPAVAPAVAHANQLRKSRPELLGLRPLLARLRPARAFAAHTMNVPSMGDSITEGTIAGVEKAVGDAVALDEIVAIIDTDKVSVEVRADAAGVIEEIFVAEDDNVEVGAQLLRIETNGAAAPRRRPRRRPRPRRRRRPPRRGGARPRAVHQIPRQAVRAGGGIRSRGARQGRAPSAKAAAPAKAVVPSGLAVEFSSVGPFFGRPEITEAEMLALSPAAARDRRR